MKNPPKTIKLNQSAQSKTQTPAQVVKNSQAKSSTPKPTTTTISPNSKPLLNKMSTNLPSSKKPYAKLLTSLVIVLAGALTGFGLNQAVGKSPVAKNTKSADQAFEEGIKVGDIIGSADEKTFRDSAEGVIVSGGIDGEGSHHLLRPGGPNQSVYLTSSELDLEELIDHKVKIWGETFAAQRAGWLMDVGRVEILELNAEKPFEEELE